MTDRTDTLPPPDYVRHITHGLTHIVGAINYYTADTVRRLLAERDAEIDRLRKLMDDEIAAGHVAASITRQIEAGMLSRIAERDERIRVLTEALTALERTAGQPAAYDEPVRVNARAALENRNG